MHHCLAVKIPSVRIAARSKCIGPKNILITGRGSGLLTAGETGSVLGAVGRVGIPGYTGLVSVFIAEASDLLGVKV